MVNQSCHSKASGCGERTGQVRDPVLVIDTLPLTVCVLTRAMRDHCFKTEADFGYCAAKDMRYYGFKQDKNSFQCSHLYARPSADHQG